MLSLVTDVSVLFRLETEQTEVMARDEVIFTRQRGNNQTSLMGKAHATMQRRASKKTRPIFLNKKALWPALVASL